MKKHGISIGIAAVIVLTVSIMLLLRYEPQKEDVTPTVREQQTVLELDTADMITVKCAGAELVFLNGGDKWTIDGAEDASGQKISIFVRNALSYKTESFLDGGAEKYGLDEPEAVIAVLADGAEHEIKIGAKSAVSDSYFASADGKAFIMTAMQRDALLKEREYYLSYGRISINADDITSFGIESEDRTIEAYIRDITDFEGNVWQMRKPYDTLASDTFIDSEVLENIAALSLSVEGTEHSRTRTVLTVTANKEYVFGIGEEKDGYVPVEYEGKVYMEPARLLAFTDADTYAFMNKLVSYVNINEISSYTADYDGKRHTTVISGTDGSFKFRSDGKQSDGDKSKAVYKSVIGITATGLYNKEKTGETVLTVTFEHKDGTVTEVKYKAINEYTVAVEKDGDTVFMTGLADVTALKRQLEEYYNG